MRPIRPSLLTVWPHVLLAASAAAQATTYTLPGGMAGCRHGRAVASIGDVDRDGCVDFAVGDSGLSSYYGRVTAYSGRDRSVLWSRSGTDVAEQLGYAIAAVGDIDGDGGPDLLVGAPGSQIQGDPRGRALVMSGVDGSVSQSLVGFSQGADFGMAVAAAGDADGDGTRDLLVGDPHEDVPYPGAPLTNAGAVYLFSDKTGALMNRLAGPQSDIYFGAVLCGGLDLDDDGELEFLMGSPDFGPEDHGYVMLASASDGLLISQMVGGVPGMKLGASICALEDASGDGIMDAAVGVPGAWVEGPSSGSVYVLSTTSLGVHAAFHGGSGSRTGTSVASAGDVDGDGRTDVWVGATHALPLLGGLGSAKLCSTSASEPLASFLGPHAGSELGYSLAASDTNGDGVRDLVAGQPGHDANGVDSGSVLVALMANSAGVAYCAGTSACPCGASASAAQAGCSNSTGEAGKLAATGRARISNDSVVLHGSGMPNSTCLYFQGTAQVNGGAGAVFGDGLRCAGGAVTRLGTRTNSMGASSFPPTGTPGLAERGGAQPGDTLHYQVWYRDTASFCTSATHNFTNAFSIAWQP